MVVGKKGLKVCVCVFLLLRALSGMRGLNDAVYGLSVWFR